MFVSVACGLACCDVPPPAGEPALADPDTVGAPELIGAVADVAGALDAPAAAVGVALLADELHAASDATVTASGKMRMRRIENPFDR
ncbi:MAG: hypothetical protein QOJ62_2603 [Actinomycetota bacterium]|nr:hypothetical protein [Actinomycetota bacterium]